MDPRRSDRVIAFKQRVVDLEALAPDWLNLLALLGGVAGLMMRVIAKSFFFTYFLLISPFSLLE